MMEPNSFTNEPQYQRPDQRNLDIDYIRYSEPLMIAQPQPQPVDQFLLPNLLLQG